MYLGLNTSWCIATVVISR